MGRSPSSTPRVAAYAVLVGLAYAAASQAVASLTAIGTSEGATFWPGAGITLGVLLARPRREWPAYLAAVAVAEFLMDVKLGFGWELGLQWAAANTVEPLIGALLLTAGGRAAPDIGRRPELLRFIAFGVVAGPLAGAIIGTAQAVLVAGDPWWPRLPRWFVGDAVGALAVAPAVLLLVRGPISRPSRRTLARGLLLLVGALLALGPWDFAGRVGLPFLVVPLVVAFAVQARTTGAAAGVLLVSVTVVAVTAAGEGPFADPDSPLQGLLVGQMFVVMAALTALTVAALMRDLVSRDELEVQLRQQALTDGLTGLANRRLLYDRLDRASQRLARHGGRVALLFVDLDDFKAVNDTLGHHSGDAVLVEVARRLSAVARAEDTVARLGGDEFLVLSEGLASQEDADRIVRRVAGVFDEPVTCPGGIAVVAGSVGVAVTDEPWHDGEKLLAQADAAMYRAKQAGGRRVLRVP